MKRIIIVHGWSGGSGKDWLPWLKFELEKKSYEVLIPDMPEPDVPVIEKWVNHLSDVVGSAGPDEDTYFVGHSMGCQTILRYIERLPAGKKIGGAVFVAGWFYLKNLEDEEVEAIAKPWLESPVDLEKIRTMILRSTLIISDNDPYDAFEENKRKFNELGSKIVVFNGAGHITAEDGFTKLPQMLSELDSLITNKKLP